jgi:hypothetical protein
MTSLPRSRNDVITENCHWQIRRTVGRPVWTIFRAIVTITILFTVLITIIFTLLITIQFTELITILF